ncbi:GTP-binding HflX domain protein [Glaesserella parasuis str. Nagasaki]|nr:GTP-binding HflX domain protein [Glaesserella parasuis str. Nagasaki]
MRVRLKNELVCERVLLPTTSGQIYTKFYQQQCIKSERFTEFGDRLVEIEVDKIQWQKWLKQYPELTEFVEFAKWEAES